jgi:subtilisin family serine protease
MNKITRSNRRVGILASLALVGAAISWGIPGYADNDGKQNAGPPALANGAKSYIVVLQDMPLVAYEGDIKGLRATKPDKGKKFNPNSSATKKYKAHLQSQQNQVQRSAGVPQNKLIHSFTAALNGFSAIMTPAQRDALANTKGVKKVIEDQWRTLHTDASPAFIGLSGPANVWQTGLTGEGVVVGVIDSGIWPEHPSFADDGSYPTPPVVLDNSRPNCEFGNIGHNANDAAFACNNKLIGARQMLDTYRALIGATPEEFHSARDDNGHGTHTASTAAGNAGVAASMFGIPRGTVSGVAHRAHVIAYKGLGDLGGFTSDLASAIDQAVLDGVDVINYSIGGGASTPGADEIAFLFADTAGVFIATSAGNSGPGAATLGNPATMPWMTTVGANTQTRFMQGTVVLDDGSEYAGASITQGVAAAALVDAEFAGGDLCFPGTLDPLVVTGKVVLCRRGAIARVGKSQAVAMAGGVGTILYNNSDVDNLSTDNHATPAVHIDQTPGLAIKAHIAAGGTPTAEIIGEQSGTWDSAPSMAIFSSRGPNPIVPDIIKPDITSVGFQVLAGNSPFPIGGVPGELFQAIGGTSMSSPHVAGAFALLKQAHPDWTPAMAKSALMTTASQGVVDNDRVSPAMPFAVGAGHMELGNKGHKGSAFQPGLAYDAGLFEYAALSCGQNWGIFSPGSCDFLDSIGVPSESRNLNYPSIGIDNLPGSQTVVRTVTSVASDKGWREYHASVTPPPGYEVSVNPSSFRLKPGQTATFEVTVTNIGAPVGEWRHGAMTWLDKTGQYSVRSPITVRAALFSAPVVVAGSGESGSASFDVNFGYTGSYVAAPHGLEPAVVTMDNVLQDPDQSFDPADGFSNQHDFNLSGAGLLRIAMPPESVTDPNVDIDIFVFDPNGTLVASSTAGGTNELVDIVFPMDGIWSVYVHGWSVPGGNTDYDMYSWVISTTPGGNLNIDSAPASAQIGNTDTVDISWTGAAAGQWHLGAISHTGDTGFLMGTLIEVDNR